MQAEHRLDFPLVQAAGERPPLADDSFDLVISEYGAALWADPHRWISEAARVLRPGGDLVFLTNSPLVVMCAFDDENTPADAVLKRPYFGLFRQEWPGESGVEYHLPHGEWVRVLRSNGFEVLNLIELRPPEGATTPFPWVNSDWARRWPSEDAWKARLRV